MNSEWNKLLTSIVIAILGITALLCITIMNLFGAAGDVGFDEFDIATTIGSIIVVYKWNPKGGGK